MEREYIRKNTKIQPVLSVCRETASRRYDIASTPPFRRNRGVLVLHYAAFLRFARNAAAALTARSSQKQRKSASPVCGALWFPAL